MIYIINEQSIYDDMNNDDGELSTIVVSQDVRSGVRAHKIYLKENENVLTNVARISD